MPIPALPASRRQRPSCRSACHERRHNVLLPDWAQFFCTGFLGYAALQHLEGTQLFLVEEPENGLHLSRIAEVMGILREVSKTSQVLIATHSPLVVNELEGHEVTVVTRDAEQGTQGTLLKDVPGFDRATALERSGLGSGRSHAPNPDSISARLVTRRAASNALPTR